MAPFVGSKANYSETVSLNNHSSIDIKEVYECQKNLLVGNMVFYMDNFQLDCLQHEFHSGIQNLFTKDCQTVKPEIISRKIIQYNFQYF